MEGIKSNLPGEFEALKKCLDYNDYRFSDCRKQERVFLDGWNAFKGYAVPEEKSE
jgi:hypothetical protein